MNWTEVYSEIPAIPTVYRGVSFRSRLEARWSAFFSILGVSHEYEPYPLTGWLPDFALAGGGLAEVKPLPPGESDYATTLKMARAVEALPNPAKPLALLFLGNGVRRDGVVGQMIRLNRLDRWRPVKIGWERDESSPAMYPRLLEADTPIYHQRICEYPRFLREKWIEAARAVRLVQP